MAHIEDLSPIAHFDDDSFHQAIEELIPEIYPHSEDLYEVSYFLEKNWLEISDTSDHDILHIFRGESTYLYSVDGRIVEGNWSIVEDTNVMILERPGGGGIDEKTLYELAFLSADFFILKRHGKRVQLEKQFLVMGRENLIRGKNWEEALDLLETRQESNKALGGIALIIAILTALYFIFS